jgi:NADP-dependent 3-hydroxy acid dehydrogenase YdfG
VQLNSLENKVAVVTGASSGIGEAAARALAAEGAKVVLVARSAEKIEGLVAELGEGFIALPTDVGDEAQVEELFGRVKDEFGGLDLLFNNAGVGYYNMFEESETEEWRATIDANLYGVLFCTRAAIPLLRGREGAMICTVSSIGGRSGIAGWAVYNATKFAVVGFNDALRKELGPDGIRCSVIEPGAVHTNWGLNIDLTESREQVEALQGEDIARALIYAFAQPANVNVQEALLMPTKQTYP